MIPVGAKTAVFQDQVQLADIVVLNWTDRRERELIDRCREWVEDFRPPKQLVVETSFGELDPEWLDRKFETTRFPMFADAHPIPAQTKTELLPVHEPDPDEPDQHSEKSSPDSSEANQARPRDPVRFQNEDPHYDACGWIFHVDDVFDRAKLLDLLGYVHPVVRLKGVFRCEDDWWTINRAKDVTSYSPSAYRRDSRLELILDRKTSGWEDFQAKLLDCLAE
ncbi:MAG: GTP-binding protein [Planctomycetota bacterium]